MLDIDLYIHIHVHHCECSPRGTVVAPSVLDAVNLC